MALRKQKDPTRVEERKRLGKQCEDDTLNDSVEQTAQCGR